MAARPAAPSARSRGSAAWWCRCRSGPGRTPPAAAARRRRSDRGRRTCRGAPASGQDWVSRRACFGDAPTRRGEWPGDDVGPAVPRSAPRAGRRRRPATPPPGGRHPRSRRRCRRGRLPAPLPRSAVAGPARRGGLPVGGPRLAARAGQHVRHLLGGPTAADHRALPASATGSAGPSSSGSSPPLGCVRCSCSPRRARRVSRGYAGARDAGRLGAWAAVATAALTSTTLIDPRGRQGRDPRPPVGDGSCWLALEALLRRIARRSAVAAGAAGRARGRAQAEPRRRASSSAACCWSAATGHDRLDVATSGGSRAQPGRRPAAGARAPSCGACRPASGSRRRSGTSSSASGSTPTRVLAGAAVEHDRPQDPPLLLDRARHRHGVSWCCFCCLPAAALGAGHCPRRRRPPPCWPSTAPG